MNHCVKKSEYESFDMVVVALLLLLKKLKYYIDSKMDIK